VQAYEVLELFVELLAVRVHLIEKSKERPQDMNEALGTLVYAAARIQVRAHKSRCRLRAAHPLVCWSLRG